MSQDNIHAARGLYDAFNRGDLNAFEKACAAKIDWKEADNSLNAQGNPYRSFDQLLEGVFQPTVRDFEDFRCDVEKLLDAGETVVSTGRYTGKYKKTGRQLSVQFCHVIHFGANAKLDAFQEYCDTLAEAEAVGSVQMVEEAKIPHPAM